MNLNHKLSGICESLRHGYDLFLEKRAAFESGHEVIYSLETKLTQEEKEALIDSFTSGAVEAVRTLQEKYEEDLGTVIKLRKTSAGYVPHTALLQKWIDSLQLPNAVSLTVKEGGIGYLNWTPFTIGDTSTTGKKFIDEIFHNILSDYESCQHSRYKRSNPVEQIKRELSQSQTRVKVYPELLFSGNVTVSPSVHIGMDAFGSFDGSSDLTPEQISAVLTSCKRIEEEIAKFIKTERQTLSSTLQKLENVKTEPAKSASHDKTE